MNYTKIINALKDKGVIFEQGLSEQELNILENFYGVNFLPDLKEFLKLALPISNGFINWRDMSLDNIKKYKIG